jgi:hypothetical protein
VLRIAPDHNALPWWSYAKRPPEEILRDVFAAELILPYGLFRPVAEEALERYADWSPDGNVLYFLSERDGFRCIRGQRLDPATKHPVGPPFDVYHFHHARQSIGTVDPISISPTVARDKMVFSMVETTGTIWMATLDRR